jgi:chromosome segregation ATPase
MAANAAWLFALAIAFLGASATAAYFWNVARRTAADLRRAKQELSDERKDKERRINDLTETRRQLEETRVALQETVREFRDVLDSPPFPTDKQLGKHLGTLASRLAAAVEEMETMTENAKEPLGDIAEEARKSRQVDRKARFDGYHSILGKAVTQANDTAARMRSALPMCANLSAALEGSQLDISTAHSTINDIITVLERSSAEYSIDDVSLTQKRSIHLDHARTMRERMEAKRDSEGAARGRSLTALEKFRTIKPTGSRDGFSPD